MALTMTECKRLVKDGKRDARLLVCDLDGDSWATNTYWAVPARVLAPLFDHFNLPTDEPASYEVDGKVTPTAAEPPDLAAIFPTETVELTPVKVGTRPALVEMGTGAVAEVFERTDTGELVHVNHAYAELARSAGPAGTAAEPTFAQRDGNGQGPVVVTIDGIRCGLVMPIRNA